jgi:hypothetical protein
MKHILNLAAMAVLLGAALDAQAAQTGINTCVVLSADTTTVLGYGPCDATSKPPGVAIDTGDARYTTFLALQPQAVTPPVNSLLTAGVAMTFTGASSAATGSFSATIPAIQYYLNVYQTQVTLNGITTVSLVIKQNPEARRGPTKTMGFRALNDLINSAIAYNNAVLVAQDDAEPCQCFPLTSIRAHIEVPPLTPHRIAAAGGRGLCKAIFSRPRGTGTAAAIVDHVCLYFLCGSLCLYVRRCFWHTNRQSQRHTLGRLIHGASWLVEHLWH